MEDVDRIIDLDNEVIARLMESILHERDIPHILRTYHDSAYDGLFQLQSGWGQLDAPEKYREVILEVYREMSESDQASG